MLETHARMVLQALGREPVPQGIFLPEQIGAALLALEASLSRQQEAMAADEATADEPAEASAPVELRQRAWPVRALLQQAQATGHFVQWQAS